MNRYSGKTLASQMKSLHKRKEAQHNHIVGVADTTLRRRCEVRSCSSRCARVFTYICVSTNGGLASFYGETMEEMWWGGGGERPAVWRRTECGEKSGGRYIKAAKK